MSLEVRVLLAIGLLAAILNLLVAGEGWRKRALLPPAPCWFAAYLALEGLTLISMFILGQLGMRNLWIGHLVLPVQTALVLLAFSAWQLDRGAAGLFRTLAAGCPLLWVLNLVGWEGFADFPLFTAALTALVCFGAATFTLIRRWTASPAPLHDQDWFWIGAGAMLFFGSFALVAPLSRYLMAQGSPETVIRLFMVRAVVQVMAVVLYWRGFRTLYRGHHAPLGSGVPA